MQRFKRVIKKIHETIRKPEMAILPGQMAFFLVLSIIPIISLIGIVGGIFSLSIETIVSFIKDSFPTDISNIIVPLISGRGADTNMVMFLIMSFIIASNGAYSIIVASNMLYGRDENKTVLKRRIKSVFLTVLIVLLFIFVLLVPVFGDKIFELAYNINVLSEAFVDKFYYLYVLLKWPISFVLIFILIKLIFTIAPDKMIESKKVNYGALLTSFLWMIMTTIYSYYVMHFAYYDIFYGSLSNIIILMFWIYLLSFAFVLGMAINANYYFYDKNVENKK